MTIANFAPLSLSLSVDNPMMDGEGGDYFFPLGVTQEAAEEEEKGRMVIIPAGRLSRHQS